MANFEQEKFLAFNQKYLKLNYSLKFSIKLED